MPFRSLLNPGKGKQQQIQPKISDLDQEIQNLTSKPEKTSEKNDSQMVDVNDTPTSSATEPATAKKSNKQNLNPFANDMSDQQQTTNDHPHKSQISKPATDQNESQENQKSDFERFTVSSHRFTRKIFKNFYKSFETCPDLDLAIDKLEQLHDRKNFKFGQTPPNMVVLTDDGMALLCHQEVLENGSHYIFVRIREFYERQGENHFPVVKLIDYDYDQTLACIKFFYTHELEIEHNNISEDLQILVNLFSSKILSDRYKTIKSKHTKYKLYQYGDKEAYTKKDHKIHHRGQKRVGEEMNFSDNNSELSDKNSILSSSKLLKYSENRLNRNSSCTNFNDTASNVASSVGQSLCNSMLSKISMASSYNNSLINGPSRVSDRQQDRHRNPY